ncbi:DgyrCDS2241 [Dimorphilus gyrociliatus]|uniref:DgyrCDS2241 n=1 Tax=Dimorphilus gyrociliatus TaxID=2664684 RepID=A0A7I8VBM9_9ANNE|nr:DgyrCDS2241 [Dimorphilus gyrociliatus]
MLFMKKFPQISTSVVDLSPIVLMEDITEFESDINNNMNRRKGRKIQKFSKNLLQLTMKNLHKICNTKVCLRRLTDDEIKKWQSKRIINTAVTSSTNTSTHSNKDYIENSGDKTNKTMDYCISSDFFNSKSVTGTRFQKAKTQKIKTAFIKAYQDEMKENEIKLETPPKSPNEQNTFITEGGPLFLPKTLTFSDKHEELKSEDDYSGNMFTSCLTPAETEDSVNENETGDSDESCERRDTEQNQSILTRVKCDECKLVAKNTEMLMVHKKIMHNLMRRPVEKAGVIAPLIQNVSQIPNGEKKVSDTMPTVESHNELNVKCNDELAAPTTRILKGKSCKSFQSSYRRRRVRAMHLECALCGYTSLKHHHLNDHLNKHIKFYAYSCSKCPHQSYTTDAMRKHIRVHHSKDTTYESRKLKELKKLFKKKFGYVHSQTRLVVQPLPMADEQISLKYPVHLLSKSHLKSLSFNSMAFGNDSHETVSNRHVKSLNQSTTTATTNVSILPEISNNDSSTISKDQTTSNYSITQNISDCKITSNGSKLKEIVKIQLKDELSKATCSNVDVILRRIASEDVKNIIFTCKHCNYRTQLTDDLQNHFLNNHASIANTLLKRLVCNSCGQIFNSRYHMTKHLEKIHQNKPKSFQKVALKLIDHWDYNFD